VIETGSNLAFAFSHLTLTGGASAASGGGVSVGGGSSAEFVDCSISGNTARGNGGGLYAESAATVTGVIFTVAPYLLPDLIPALHECAPQMPLDLDENLTEHLESALRSGRIDVAIIALPFTPPGIVTEFLYEEPFRVVVPADHKWARRKSIHPNELAAEQLILLDIGHCFRAQVLDACPELSRAEAHVARTSSLETVATW
jgi:predicted outer membrane repeat protein